MLSITVPLAVPVPAPAVAQAAAASFSAPPRAFAPKRGKDGVLPPAAKAAPTRPSAATATPLLRTSGSQSSGLAHSSDDELEAAEQRALDAYEAGLPNPNPRVPQLDGIFDDEFYSSWDCPLTCECARCLGNGFKRPARTKKTVSAPARPPPAPAPQAAKAANRRNPRRAASGPRMPDTDVD